ncbi:MAG: hypothetical protein IKL96_01560 [Kiritimatiellae bacterium]|nr:hypothetical protein [Kiritimatiellia bacterium]
MTKAKTPKKAVWRETRRKGVRVLIDPDGNVYYGTPEEVREAALMPRRRDALAQSIEWARHTADKFNYTPDERREYIREKRRDAIHSGNYDAHFGESVHVPSDVYILLKAGARLVCDSFDEFLAEVCSSQLEALLDVAARDTGKREIPLTRYERAALDRLRGNVHK